MKRFHWRLQRVLDVKQKQEQALRAQLIDITERLGKARGELFMQKRILEDLIESVSEEKGQERLSRQEFFMACSKANDTRIKKLENDINVLAAQQKEKIAEVVKMKQFNEGLTRLRAQAEAEYFEEQQKLEQKDMDEASTGRFARRLIQTQEATI